MALVLGGGLLAVLTAGWIARSRKGFDPVFVSGVMLLSAILTIVVLFVLGRNLVKLYLDRSRGRPGSGYGTKVVSLVSVLTLLPSLLLFVTASGILQQAVEQWFEPQVEGVLGAGQRFLEAYEEVELERSVRLLRHLAAEVEQRRLLRGGSRAGLEKLIREKRAEYGAPGLRIYSRQGAVLVEDYDRARHEALRPLTVPGGDLAALLEGRLDMIRYHPDKSGEVLWFIGVPIRSGERVGGAVVVASGLGQRVSSALAEIDENGVYYEQAKANKEGVKQGYVLVLAFFTLLLLFSAVWVGSSLAKSVTGPIQTLAIATQAVSEGRFDVTVDVDAPDELGVLVRSFNRMLEELRLGKVDVELSTRDLRRTNIELEGRRKYIETILESVPTGVLSLDQDGQISNLNPAAAHMLGLTGEQIVGAHYRDVFAPKEFLELNFLIDKVLGIRDINLTRELHLRVNRRAVDLAVSFTALRDPRDQYIGLIVVLEDLSNLIKAQKIAAWREVARRIAHEIKNPLTPIQLSAQRIWKKWSVPDEERDNEQLGRIIRDCTETITQEVDGLKTLVNEFSRFARMPPVAPVPTQLDKVIHNALVLYEGQHADLVIHREIAPDMPTISLDAEQMKRVLINLIDNAIHCQGGAGWLAVTASHDARTQSIRLTVADHGPGIPPEDRDKLFVPYFSTRKGGTGLGLAIVHRVVSDHNGRIRVEENQPRGTRFVIDLPA